MQVSTGRRDSLVDSNGSQQMETIVAIVREVGVILKDLPYIQPLGALMLQFVTIRNVCVSPEVSANLLTRRAGNKDEQGALPRSHRQGAP